MTKKEQQWKMRSISKGRKQQGKMGGGGKFQKQERINNGREGEKQGEGNDRGEGGEDKWKGKTGKGESWKENTKNLKEEMILQGRRKEGEM